MALELYPRIVEEQWDFHPPPPPPHDGGPRRVPRRSKGEMKDSKVVKVLAPSQMERFQSVWWRRRRAFHVPSTSSFLVYVELFPEQFNSNGTRGTKERSHFRKEGETRGCSLAQEILGFFFDRIWRMIGRSTVVKGELQFLFLRFAIFYEVAFNGKYGPVHSKP